MRNAVVIPLDAAESRVAEAMMGLVNDDAERFGTGGRDWTLPIGGGLHDLGSQISAAMVGAYCADDC